MKDEQKNKFKYNVSFYYQSTIMYFVVFAVYLIVRGEFIDNSYTLITKDPIIYLLALIVIISLVSLLFNIYRNRYIEFDNEGIRFNDKFKSRLLKKQNMIAIKMSKDRRSTKSNALRFVRIKMKTRRRPVIVRPSDYENENELIVMFNHLKEEIENR